MGTTAHSAYPVVASKIGLVAKFDLELSQAVQESH